jgi:alkanesulfonate monooxygenase SsuD/methylene tetrahydromethanopterin reductase-like flavin-dependent oxidoreductase (luciferase family)
MAVGSPKQIKERLESLAEECGVDEVVISTFTEQFADRLRSYELLATTFGLKSRVPSPEHRRNSL